MHGTSTSHSSGLRALITSPPTAGAATTPPPQVRTTSAGSTPWTRTLVSASCTTVTGRVVTSTPAEAGGHRPASQPASDRARPTAAARARGLPRTSTSSSPATSPAGLATAAGTVLRRAVAEVADLGSSMARPMGAALSTIGSSLGRRHWRSMPPRAWKALVAGEGRCCGRAEPRDRPHSAARRCPCGRCAVAGGLRAEGSAVHDDEGNGHVLGC
jgi:hypothetical protein